MALPQAESVIRIDPPSTATILFTVTARMLFLLAWLAMPALAAAADLAAYARGMLADGRGDLAAARSSYDAALAADPDSLTLLRKSVSLRVGSDDLVGASTLLRDAADRRPERLDIQLCYVDFLLQNSPDDGYARQLATRTLEAALKRAPGSPLLTTKLFRLYENAERRADALSLFRNLLAAPRPEVEYWYPLVAMANTLFPADSEEFRESLDKIHREILRLAPENADAVREAADYFRLSRRLDEAIAILRGHATAYPASLEMRTRLGILLLADQKTADGEAELLAVLRIDADLPLPHQTLAKSFERRGEKQLARHHRSELLRIRGGGPREYLALADEYLADSQNRDARLVLEKARFAYPQDAAVAARLAVATSRDPSAPAGATADLFRLAESLAKARNQPEVLDPAFLEAYGQSLNAAGEQPAAEDQLRAAIRSFPPDQPKELAAALRRLAELWLDANKNHAAAASLIQRADKLDPDHPHHQELLRRAQTP